MSCRLLFFLPEYRQYSTTEDKQTEGSRCKGVDHSLLVCCNGHLAVTRAGISKKEWFAPLYFMIEIMKKTLLTICFLLLASWSAAVAQVNPAKVSKIGDQSVLKPSAECNQLQVKDKGVKADSEEETWVACAVGTYVHGASGSLYVNAFGQEVPNMLGKYAPSQKYDAVLYRSSKKSNRYVIEPYMNGQQLGFQVDNATGYVVVGGSSSGMQGNAGTIVVVDSYSVLGEYPSVFDEEAGVIDFYLLLGDNQYYYGVDNDQFVITEYVTHGTCGKNGGDNVIWQLDLETGELLIHGSGEMEDYIADLQPWAGQRDKISSIRIAEGVTNVGGGAFALHEKIKNVELPNSITSIGDHAFKTCSGLTSLELPNSITSIRDFAFYGCSGLSHLVFPNSITSIGYAVVYGCSNLTNFVIPNSVTSIGEKAFYDCTSLKSIEIPNSVTTIGRSAFYNCTNLKSIKIPNSVTTIGEEAFYKCRSLTSIEIPNSVTTIGEYTFYDCKSLESIEISNSVTTIGSSAFKGCSGLTRIVIPNSVTTIGKEALDGIKTVINLSKVYVYNVSGQKVINALNGFIEDNFVLGEVDKLETLVAYIGDDSYIRLPRSYQGKKYVVGEKVFEGYLNMTDLDIPEYVKLLSDRAFYGCENLTNMYIGSGVKMIGNETFSGCKNLEKIYMMGSVPPTVGSENFTFTQYVGVELYVPKGSLAAYQSADTWKDFWEIKEFDATGIENVEEIVGKDVSVYTTNGKLVQQIPNYNGAPLRLPKGVYVVRAGKETKKVLVK